MYFTNRQDRYIRFQKQKQLSDYYAQLIQLVGNMSFHVKISSEHSAPSLLPPKAGNPLEYAPNFKAEATLELEAFLSRWMQSTHGALQKSATGEPKRDLDTIIMPTLQMGPFGIRQDEQAISRILSWFAKSGRDSVAYITSGYFNFTPQYQALILKSESPVKIITASPQANGFYESAGISKHLPSAYTWIESKFYKTLVKNNKTNIEIREYLKDGWSYHAKGE
jgi:CDP-diacylglycerol--glycerol-3-phosphate 3-phosphatidyltransferase